MMVVSIHLQQRLIMRVCCRAQFSCNIVRDYVGFTLVVRLFSNAVQDACIVEFQCMHARGRGAFFSLFNEVAAALAAAGHLAAQPPMFGMLAPMATPALGCARDDDELDIDIVPLLAMVQSSDSSVQQEAMRAIAKIVDDASPRVLACFIRANLLDALQSSRATLAASDFEACINCERAICKLVKHASHTCTLAREEATVAKSTN